MAKKAYIGVDGVARKVKKMYVGVDGAARKIKKGYIGVGGVARPFWTGGELAYYGKITPPTSTYSYSPTASVGKYGLFFGGDKIVDAYDSSLTHSNPAQLNENNSEGTATTVGDYAIVARISAEAYSSSLVKSIITNLTDGPSPYYRGMFTAATVGNHALFGGGTLQGRGVTSTVDVYDSSLTHSIATQLSLARSALKAVSVGNYVLFAGGTTDAASSSVATVDWYDSSLTKGIATNLSAEKFNMVNISHGEYGLFLGGTNKNATSVMTVDVYTTSLTKVSVDNISNTANNMNKDSAGVSIGDFALHKCDNVNVIDVYDRSLVHTTFDVSASMGSRYGYSTVSVGDYALFGTSPFDKKNMYAFTA